MSDVQPVNRMLGVVLGLCGHWWQAKTVPEVMAMDCPRCGRPPGVFIDCWDEKWPEPDPEPETFGSWLSGLLAKEDAEPISGTWTTTTPDAK